MFQLFSQFDFINHFFHLHFYIGFHVVIKIFFHFKSNKKIFFKFNQTTWQQIKRNKQFKVDWRRDNCKLEVKRNGTIFVCRKKSIYRWEKSCDLDFEIFGWPEMGLNLCVNKALHSNLAIQIKLHHILFNYQKLTKNSGGFRFAFYGHF